MLHGYINKRMDNGSIEKQNLQKTGITEKRSQKGNGQCKCNSIIL